MHEDHAADRLTRPWIPNEPDTALAHRRYLGFDILNGQRHQIYSLAACCPGLWRLDPVASVAERAPGIPPGQVVESVLEAVVGRWHVQSKDLRLKVLVLRTCERPDDALSRTLSTTCPGGDSWSSFRPTDAPVQSPKAWQHAAREYI